MAIGKVVFIGAGPGDPELITVKGMRYLQQAEVVVYAGSLVNSELLKWARPDAEVYNS
ncbi:MAG: SAM-dependent methyltransferase, partial [Pyrobaculum sp.]